MTIVGSFVNVTLNILWKDIVFNNSMKFMEKMSKTWNRVGPNRVSKPVRTLDLLTTKGNVNETRRTKKKKGKKIFVHKSTRIRDRKGAENKKKLTFISSSYITCSQKL